MERMSTDARRAARRRIRDRVEAEAAQRVRQLLMASASHACAAKDHDGCRYTNCLCECHDGEESRATGYRCSACGGGVKYTSGTMSASAWSHITTSDHPAQPVRKRENA